MEPSEWDHKYWSVAEVDPTKREASESLLGIKRTNQVAGPSDVNRAHHLSRSSAAKLTFPDTRVEHAYHAGSITSAT